MLQELHIRDFAIIDQLRIIFDNRLNVLTGETGAGKSIVIDAVNVLLGDKVSREAIREGKEEAVVEGLFDLSSSKEIKGILDEFGLPAGDDLLIKRVISRKGKNRGYVNGSIATLSMLTAVGERLIDIYGQHEHQSLIRPWSHLDILDSFGGLWPLRGELRDRYRRFLSLQKEINELTARSETRSKRVELLYYQLQEIEEAHLKVGEEEELKMEKDRLKYSERIREATQNSFKAIYSSDGSILEKLDRMIDDLKRASQIDEGIKRLTESLQSTAFQLEDISLELRDYCNDIDTAPEHLEEIEERLTFLAKLKRKHGTDISGVMKLEEEMREELKELTRGDEKEKALEEEIKHLEERLHELSRDISGKRVGFSKSLEEGVMKELSGLGMEKARFEIRIEKRSMGEKGVDSVEFYLSTNPGEGVRPLSKIASGGELSRIMLALKLTAKTKGVPTLILDEIDAGVGGKVADGVGVRLRRLSSEHQVLCITHLPQIASYGSAHYHVFKEEIEDRTVVNVKRLDPGERVKEVSRMLAGANITEKTRKHAEEMLINASMASSFEG